MALAIAWVGNINPTLGSSNRKGAWQRATTCRNKRGSSYVDHRNRSWLLVSKETKWDRKATNISGYSNKPDVEKLMLITSI